jgi:hypothetical protein
MLRHKAAIQCARYAFGFAGIMEPDEYERMVSVETVEPSTPPAGGVAGLDAALSDPDEDAIEADIEAEFKDTVPAFEPEPGAEDPIGSEEVPPSVVEPETKILKDPPPKGKLSRPQLFAILSEAIQNGGEDWDKARAAQLATDLFGRPINSAQQLTNVEIEALASEINDLIEGVEEPEQPELF